MADMRKAFAGFFKAADVDEPATHTITSVAEEKVGEDQKWVVRFNGEKRGLVLNVTNNNRLVGALGWDSDGWVGRRITLTVEKVPGMRGGLVDGIVVHVPQAEAPKRRTVTGKAKAAADAQAPFDDPIPDFSVDAEIV